MNVGHEIPPKRAHRQRIWSSIDVLLEQLTVLAEKKCGQREDLSTNTYANVDQATS